MEPIQKLVILGLLKSGPKHGYSIKSEISKIRDIFALDNKSIYYPLRTMEKQGLLVKTKGRFGKRPEKYVYKLTPQGERQFQGLLSKSFLSIRRPTFDIDVALFFLPYIKPQEFKRSLALRERVLRRIEKNMKSMVNSSVRKLNAQHLAIIQHNLDLIATEIKFLTNLASALKKA